MKENIEEDIKTLEQIKDIFLHLKFHGWINDIKRDVNTDEAIKAIDDILSDYKRALKENEELKEKLKEEEELNKIIKNTKLDKFLNISRKNGKTIELAMQLREEILKLPKCRLYGIKNCKNKIVLLTKEECIPVQEIKDKIEELNQKIENEENEKVIVWLHKQRRVLQELLEGRK